MASTSDTRSESATPARGLKREFLALDGEIEWACSGRGWNCCVDKDIPVRPYDVHRLAAALCVPPRQLVDDGIVSLEWDGYGILGGWLATRPYGSERDDRSACVFYEEVTTTSAKRIRDEEPERFRRLPSTIRDATDDRDERPVAGLCNAHSGRPEACRAYPFQRHPLWEDHPERTVARIADCGACSLAEPTTPRQVMLDNGLEDYWRADEAYRAVVQYLHKSGLANLRNSTYRPLPLPLEERRAFWTALFTAETPFPDTLRHVLDRADSLIEAAGVPREHLGGAGPPLERPDVGALLDGSRAVLPG